MTEPKQSMLCVGGPMDRKTVEVRPGVNFLNVPVWERGGIRVIVYERRTFGDEERTGDVFYSRLPPMRTNEDVELPL